MEEASFTGIDTNVNTLEKKADNESCPTSSVADSMPFIHWPLSCQPSLVDEVFMRSLLVLSDHEQGRYIELPTERQHFIDQAARERGFLTTGAYSLRRQLIRQTTGGGNMYFGKHKMGCPTEANNHAENFERKLEQWLSTVAPEAKYRTESQLKREGSPLTPDFLFPEGVRINGSVVHWLDCKTYYGSSLLATAKSLPVGKLKGQADKYCGRFGPGAFVFLNGFSGHLLNESGMDPQSVVLLDAGPLDPRDLYPPPDLLFKEEVYVPHPHVGRVIGKKGATINALKRDYGCNVVLHHLPHSCIVVLTSAVSAADVERARDQVKVLISRNGARPKPPTVFK